MDDSIMLKANAFAELDDVIGALVPQHRTSKRPADLPSDAPSRVRALWEAIGFGPATNEARKVAFPSLEQSEAELRRIFEAWTANPKSRARWNADGGVAAFRAHLPARCRLIKDRGDEIDVTDETVDADDPPVLAMRREAAPVLVWHERYTEWLIWELLGVLTTTRSTGYDDRGQLAGEQVLLGVYPKMWRLADRIWWMEMPKYSRKDELPVNATKIFFASVEDYLAFVLALPDDKIGYTRSPRLSTLELRSAGPLDLFKGTPEGFRSFTRLGHDRPDQGRHAIGPVGDTVVMLDGLEKGPVGVGFNPMKREQIFVWLKSLAGVKIAAGSETKLRPGYDKFGW
jgi:hypothetical protein